MAIISKAARRKKRNEILMGIGIFAVVLTLLGSLGAYYVMNDDKVPDSVTLCPADGPLGHTVVLIDNTDTYNFMQRQSFAQSIAALSEDQVPEGHLLSVYVLGADFTENASPVFEKCNPGKGEDKSNLTANLDRIKKRYHEQFKDPILKLAENSLLDKQSERSPIFEMLQIASINGFRAKDVDGERTLIVYSDMLPNTQEFSMFKGLPAFDDFLKSAYGRKSQTSLSGVKVHVHYLLNYPKLQTRTQLSFWETYFEQAGAKIVAVKTLEG